MADFDIRPELSTSFVSPHEVSSAVHSEIVLILHLGIKMR